MKKQREDKKNEDAPSRRRFIKGVAGGIAASLAVDMTPVAKALGANMEIQAERDLVIRTIGETTRQLMDSSIQSTPDLPKIYQGLGGKNPITIKLLAQTFGSPSTEMPGSYTLEASAAPNLSALTAALASNMQSFEGQAGVTVSILSKGQPAAGRTVFRVPDISVRDITINCD
jgi:hypothetical protein